MSLYGDAYAKHKVQGRINILRSEVISAYQIAVNNGFEGTVEEWLEAIKGEPGAVFTPDVDSDGTLSWTNNGGLPNPASINIRGADGKDGRNGKDGADGRDGAAGYTPVKGTDYYTEADKEEMEEAVLEHFGMPAEVEFSKAGNTVGVDITEEDGSSIHQTIMLDANGIPKSVTQYGVTCNLVWEGFE